MYYFLTNEGWSAEHVSHVSLILMIRNIIVITIFDYQPSKPYIKQTKDKVNRVKNSLLNKLHLVLMTCCVKIIAIYQFEQDVAKFM